MSREKQIDLKGMRAYEELSDIHLPIEQEEMMDIICDAWEECQQSDCRVCTERPHRNMRIMACTALKYTRLLREAGYRKQSEGEWISVEDRLPTEDEYLTHHNDGLNTLKRITVAYMTDTIEYTIGCYDGYKWVNQLGNKKINDVVAWKPFELYKAPKMKGGAE